MKEGFTMKVNEQGNLISYGSISLFFSLQIIAVVLGAQSGQFHTGQLLPGISTILMGISLIILGILFLISYYFSYKAFLFRLLMWLCENFSKPKGRGMAFFYSTLSIIGGLVAILRGFSIV
mgnify:CR=1 FL=1